MTDKGTPIPRAYGTLARPRSPYDWQPIETYPNTDCEDVLVSDGEAVWLAWYSYEGQWFDATMGDRNGGEIAPTHWMPLPEPPL